MPLPLPPPHFPPPSVAVLLIIIDGLGDTAVAALGGVTPLAAAALPTLDALARRGALGLVDPVAPGLACGSDTAHLSLMGVPPAVTYRGRGAFEAAGAGLPVGVGDVAFKSVLACVDDAGGGGGGCEGEGQGQWQGGSGGGEGGPQGQCAAAAAAPAAVESVVRHRRPRGGFTAADGVALTRALAELTLPSFPDIQVAVTHAGGHRLAVRLRGTGLSDAVTDTDPLVDGRPLRVAAPAATVLTAASAAAAAAAVATTAPSASDSADAAAAAAAAAAARHTAAAMVELSAAAAARLAAHPLNAARVRAGELPVNALLLRGAAGAVVPPPPRRCSGEDGLGAALRGRAFGVAPTAVVGGVLSSLGVPLVAVPGATGGFDSDLNAKAAAAARLLCEHGRARGGDGGRAGVRSQGGTYHSGSGCTPGEGSGSDGGGVGGSDCGGAGYHARGGGDDAGGGNGYAYDFGILHVKAVDDAGHAQDAALKVRTLERVDAMVATLLDRLAAEQRRMPPPLRPSSPPSPLAPDLHGADSPPPSPAARAPSSPPLGHRRIALVLTGDHSTPVERGDHGAEPVPLLLVTDLLGRRDGPLPPPLPPPPPQSWGVGGGTACGAGGAGGADATAAAAAKVAFDEVAAAAGVLGRFPGSELMGLIGQVSQGAVL